MPFNPGGAPQPPLKCLQKGGWVWVGSLILGGWVPQIPPDPPLL